MNVKVRNRGSLEDMMNAFQDKLEELGGDIESCVNSNEDIESNCYKDNKVEESCDKDVESCGDYDASLVNGKNKEIYSDDEDDLAEAEENIQYFMDVYDDVSDMLYDDGAEDIDYSIEETSFKIVFTLDGNIYDVNVPFEDITGNFEQDVNAIYDAAIEAE